MRYGTALTRERLYGAVLLSPRERLCGAVLLSLGRGLRCGAALTKERLCGAALLSLGEVVMLHGTAVFALTKERLSGAVLLCSVAVVATPSRSPDSRLAGRLRTLSQREGGGSGLYDVGCGVRIVVIVMVWAIVPFHGRQRFERVLSHEALDISGH